MLVTQSNLNARSRAFSLVLNDSGANVFQSSNNIKNKILTQRDDVEFIAVIKHDIDFDDERGCYKTIHYHVVVEFLGNYRCSSVLNWLVAIFHCNANQISIEKCNSVAMQTRYLIHLDDRDKVQYSKLLIATNRFDICERYFKQVKHIANEYDLLAVMHEYPRLQDLILAIGLNQYKKWRVVIQDLRKDY